MYKLRLLCPRMHNEPCTPLSSFIHLFNNTRDIQVDPMRKTSKVASLSSSRRNHHFLLFVSFIIFYENKESAVEGLENTKMNHKEGSK